MEKGQKQEGSVCIVCGAKLAQATAAVASHMRKHVKDKSMEEIKNEDGKLAWIATGEDPQYKTERIMKSTHWRKPPSRPPRQPSKAKSDKKGKISIQCQTCGKYCNDTKQFADQRFVSINCCDRITIFPQRMVNTLINNPGREYLE